MPGGHPHCNGSARKANPRDLIKKCGEEKTRKNGISDRLHVKGVFMGFQRGQRTQTTNTHLIKLEDVNVKEDAEFYHGKRLAYIYKASKADKKGSKLRVIWGKVTRSHGNSGVVRASFKKNLPPKAMGQRVRCMLYPSRV